MKKVLFLSMVAIGFASCGGWNDEKRSEVKSECGKSVGNLYTKEDAAKICDCVSSKITEKFPTADYKPSDVNEQTKACIKDGNYVDILTKEQEESYKQLETTIDSVGKSLDEQINNEMSKLPK